MEKIEPKIPRGFPEYLPREQIAFNKMLEQIRASFERFGYAPLETSAVEYAEVLLAKGGGETDKQVYRFEKGDKEYCLHFDLTVPLARYVAANYRELAFPFRRYQIQKVWRAENPQLGRFREFYQCDVDLIGSKSIPSDAEMVAVIYETFRALGLPDVTIRISNRKLLAGYLEALGIKESTKVMRLIDKLEKQGPEAVGKLMEQIGLTGDQVQKVLFLAEIQGVSEKVIRDLEQTGTKSAQFAQGLKEIRELAAAILAQGIPAACFKIDLGIARGLDYYTGTVYETYLNKYPEVGSVCSGGRYDDLTGYYLDKELPGVGVSIGLTRLFEILKEKKEIEMPSATPTKVLFASMDEKFLATASAAAARLRGEGVNVEVYPERSGLAEQLKYANKIGIPYVAIIGEDEQKAGKFTLKEMKSGEQKLLSVDEIVREVKGQPTE